MLKIRLSWLALAGSSVLFASTLQAETTQENFSTDPLQRGLLAFGNTNLFHWNATNGNLDVTWDSRETNSYFCLPLGTVLGKDDNFSLAFDLRLNDFTPGIDPAKTNSPFIRIADATAPGFIRGSGYQSPNIVEFSFFPDPGGEWQWGPSLTVMFCSRTGLEWSRDGFASGALTTNDVFRIVMIYDATNQVMNTEIQRNGEAFVTVPPAILDMNFTDFRVDAVAVCSYSDVGQWPGYEGSILAHGSVDNFVVTLPPLPVGNVSGGFNAGVWQVQFTSRSNWLCTLERTADFSTWVEASPAESGNGATLVLQDTNAPADKAFYRIRAERP